jgi:hypothetical protein
VAAVSGDIVFRDGRRLTVRERLSTESGSVVLLSYGYEVWQGHVKLYWYDSQPHPGERHLAAREWYDARSIQGHVLQTDLL